MDVRQRKALGCFALLAYLAIYTIAAATLGATVVTAWPAWAQLIFFLVAGLIWIAPLRPLFRWMNRG
ncbi:MAG: DUF2842 domain-containing protein [Hyphomonadaceae bacterium]